MSSLAAKFANQFTSSARSTSALLSGVQRSSKLCYSTVSLDGDNDGAKNSGADDFHDDFIPEKRESIPQGVDPKRGWNFRGVHKAIICGKVRQSPVQKLLRSGRTLTIFNVGTGGLWDHRVMGAKDLPKPAQWHRVVVHNEMLGAYAVQQLVKNSSVYVEGDIEIRVYNKGITGEVVRMPEICVRNDGKVRLIKPGESTTNIPFEELREGLQ
ncbi:single-stranded DNA-binding protein, mitochondrial-like [Chenopodium quinoa]|uniref:single-stranded DNA-binding protein, mitochondrial-like n=1 Tax=Chenopodium quinoa TaxID=63459 RepID=UPI000B771E33|nr:single-stranded DNA-binding protein, mitochondrial-like [Chenopodium quinoa]